MLAAPAALQLKRSALADATGGTDTALQTLALPQGSAPQDVAALHGLLLALEKIPRSQLQPILGDWQNFTALIGLLPLTRAAVKPAGAPVRLSLRFKKSNKG